MGHQTNNGSSDQLIRAEVWSSQLKDILEDELMATSYVRWLTEFPDGDTFTIPSIGAAQVDDYIEGESIKFRNLSTGEFQFSITDYLASAHSISDKAKEDLFYMSELVSQFVPKQARAIMTSVETKILNLSASQTASNANVINDADHRFVGTGTSETMALADFAKANYALTKANVPDSGRIAIVDPSVAFELETLSNLTNVSNNPRFEGIVETGLSKNMRFVKNVYGFDVLASNYLADANETIGGLTTAAGKANMFFSADADVLPFIGAWRRMPEVEFSRSPEFQEDRFITSARYGVKLFRPENLVCVLTDTDQV